MLADSEHFASELLQSISEKSPFDIMVPIPHQRAHLKRWASIPNEEFRPQWAGFATAKNKFSFKYGAPGEYVEIVERLSEKPEEYRYKASFAQGMSMRLMR